MSDPAVTVAGPSLTIARSALAGASAVWAVAWLFAGFGSAAVVVVVTVATMGLGPR